jgi:myo-inositol-1(or 4)-monophosphatase
VSVDLNELLALAQVAVDAVGPGLAAPDSRLDLGIDTKSSPTDMVTAMDRWAEETIVGVLLDARPDDGLLGEEGANKASETGVVWVIDPIDGTTNFIRDLPGFSVSIAARINGVDSVGVVHDLVRSERFTVMIGSGAFCNGEALHVSEPVDLARAVLGTGFSYQPAVRAEQAKLIAELLPEIADIRRFGGAALDCCSVACGRLDAYYEVGVQDWDIAAGGLLVREAGGRTLDQHPDGPFVCGSVTIFDELLGRLGLID